MKAKITNKNKNQANKLKIKINKKVRAIDFKQKNPPSLAQKSRKPSQTTQKTAKVRKPPCNLLKNNLEFTPLS
jgi:hypothetical protein